MTTHESCCRICLVKYHVFIRRAHWLAQTRILVLETIYFQSFSTKPWSWWSRRKLSRSIYLQFSTSVSVWPVGIQACVSDDQGVHVHCFTAILPQEIEDGTWKKQPEMNRKIILQTFITFGSSSKLILQGCILCSCPRCAFCRVMLSTQMDSRMMVDTSPCGRACCLRDGMPCCLLVGGFKYFLFSPLFGEDFQFD